jgi:hypothetical protein
VVAARVVVVAVVVVVNAEALQQQNDSTKRYAAGLEVVFIHGTSELSKLGLHYDRSPSDESTT